MFNQLITDRLHVSKLHFFVFIVTEMKKIKEIILQLCHLAQFLKRIAWWSYSTLALIVCSRNEVPKLVFYM